MDARPRPTRPLVSPRCVVFLERDGRWLFLRGGPRKWFAGLLNGVGGHVEPGESLLAAARREVREETGLAAISLRLVDAVPVPPEREGGPPVLLGVCVGTLPDGELTATDEGEHVWRSADEALGGGAEFVADVPGLFRLALGRRGVR